MPPIQIKSRLVLYFPGFEAIEPMAQLGRLKYSTDKSANIWNFDQMDFDATVGEDGHFAIAESVTTGKDWKVETRFVHFDWSDIIASYKNHPYPASLFKYLPRFLAFFLDGTNIRYFKASRRYWLFSIFPIVAILLFMIASWLAAGGMLAIFNAGDLGGLSILLQIIAAIAFVLILGKWPGDRFYLNLTINMSGLIRTMAEGNNSVIEQRSNEFANILKNEIATGKYDEILIVGHCIGAAWAMLALSKSLKRKEDLLKATNTVFFALASSIPRIALAPCASHMRDHLGHVMSCPDLLWHEIQTKDDVISFYKADPFKILGVVDTKARYIIHRVRFKTAMARDRYRKMRKSFYRTHRQYVLYYDKPVHFDFVLRCFGPLSARELADDIALAQRFESGNKFPA